MNKKIVFVLLAGCIVVCLCSVVAGAGIYIYMRSQQESNQIIEDDDIVFEDTITPTEDEDEFIYEEDDTDVYGELFVETFDDNRNEWELGDYSGQYINSNEEIRDGKLYYYGKAIIADGGFTYDSLYQQPYMNFEASIEAKQISGIAEADYGLIFRKNNDYLYLFLINEAYGEYMLSVYNDDLFTDVMADWVSTSLISATSANELKVVAIENEIKLYINDVLVETIYDDTLMEAGDIGVVVNLYDIDHEALVEFDNLKIQQR